MRVGLKVSDITSTSCVSFAGETGIVVRTSGDDALVISAKNADEFANWLDSLHDAVTEWRARENEAFGADLDAAKDAA